MRWTIFMMLRTSPAWLQLDRQERDRVAGEVIGGIFGSDAQGGTVSFRFYDAEAFTASCTDIAVFETSDLQGYYFAIERLRDSSLFSRPYFEVVEIIPTIENGFRQFDAHKAGTA